MTVHSHEMGENGCPRGRHQNQDMADFTGTDMKKGRRNAKTETWGRENLK